MKPLGRQIGSGMFKCIPPEDAFLIPEIDVRNFYFTLHFAMDYPPVFKLTGYEFHSSAKNLRFDDSQFEHGANFYR